MAEIRVGFSLPRRTIPWVIYKACLPDQARKSLETAEQGLPPRWRLILTVAGVGYDGSL